MSLHASESFEKFTFNTLKVNCSNMHLWCRCSNGEIEKCIKRSYVLTKISTRPPNQNLQKF